MESALWAGRCHPQQLKEGVVARWEIVNCKAGSPPPLSLFERPGACGTWAGLDKTWAECPAQHWRAHSPGKQ